MADREPGTVWRAMADPTRRRLVELLRDGPQTTGALCDAFPVTRFAVLKHLAVLRRAGIVTVRRQGRERWNTLRDEALRQLGARWLSNDAASPLPGSPRDLPGEGRPLRTFRITFDTFLDASPATVFDALTVRAGAWWLRAHPLAPEASMVVVEPQLGGRFYEEWGHREGVIRGTVTAVKRDEQLELTGAIAGAALLPSVLSFRLERREGGTLLHVSHAGVLEAPDAPATLDGMWKELIKRRLKPFVEHGTRTVP